MKKIMVTGCNGQLGRAINKQYADCTDITLLNTDVGNPDVKELDITNIDMVLNYVRAEKPDAIINCAAFTAVDACETSVDAAYRINAIGPRNLSIAATDIGAKLMHISTDYVFAGNASSPYIEFDTPNPQSMYGTTKLAGENFVKEFAKDYFIIRTAWLYGDGKNFAKTMLRLSETHDVIKVVNDQIGSPTSAAELAKMIAYLLPTDNYGLFHGTCEGICSWADFTKEIFRLAGRSTTVDAVTTEQYMSEHPESAKRPAYSVLENYMLKLTTDFQMADWKNAIASYIGNIQ
ncbi:MAG: dTDP-4-dehydrorhamnose reductase [bacterium]|nr:dTDP-4-dehydrorhamnose reductase [bacterium]